MNGKRTIRRGLCLVKDVFLPKSFEDVLLTYKVIAKRDKEIVIAQSMPTIYWHVPEGFDRHELSLFHYSLKERWDRVLNDYLPYLVLRFVRYGTSPDTEFLVTTVEEPVAHRVYGDFTVTDGRGKEVDFATDIKSAIMGGIPMIKCIRHTTRHASHGGALFFLVVPRGYAVKFTWRTRVFRDVATKSRTIAY